MQHVRTITWLAPSRPALLSATSVFENVFGFTVRDADITAKSQSGREYLAATLACSNCNVVFITVPDMARYVQHVAAWGAFRMVGLDIGEAPAGTSTGSVIPSLEAYLPNPLSGWRSLIPNSMLRPEFRAPEITVVGSGGAPASASGGCTVKEAVVGDTQTLRQTEQRLQSAGLARNSSALSVWESTPLAPAVRVHPSSYSSLVLRYHAESLEEAEGELIEKFASIGGGLPVSISKHGPTCVRGGEQLMLESPVLPGLDLRVDVRDAFNPYFSDNSIASLEGVDPDLNPEDRSSVGSLSCQAVVGKEMLSRWKQRMQR